MESCFWRRYLLIDLETSDCFDSADVTGHGLFQKKVQILTVLSFAIVLSNTRTFKLISSPVDHWCKPPAHLSYLSEVAWRNIGIPLDADGKPSSCNASMLAHPYDASNSSADVFACEAWDYDKERANSSVVSLWNLVCHRAWLLPAAEAVCTSGAMLAAVAAGYAADHAGRKPVIIAATTMLLLASFAFYFTDSYAGCVAVGVVLYGSSGALFAVTSLLFFELGTHAHRAWQLCLAIMAGYVPASLLFMALQQARLPWRQLQMAMASPTALAPLFYVFVVESPRWLLSTKQFYRAEAEIAAAGLANRFAKHADDVSIVKRLRDMSGPKVESLKANLVAVIGIPVVRRRAAIVFASSFAVAFTFHALSPTAGLTRAWGGWMSFIAAAALFAVLLLILKRFQRLIVFIANLSLLASCSCLASLSFRIGEETFGRVFLVLARALSLTGLTVNYIYVLELFPTALRGVFFCTSYAFGELGATFAAVIKIFFDPRLEDSVLGSVVFITFNAVLLLVHITEPEEEPRVAPSAALQPLKSTPTRRSSARRWVCPQDAMGAPGERKYSGGEAVAVRKEDMRRPSEAHPRIAAASGSPDKGEGAGVLTPETASFD